MDPAKKSETLPHPQLRQIESLFGSAATVQATLITEVTTENGAIPPTLETLTRSRRSTESPEAHTIVEQSVVRDFGCDLHGAGRGNGDTNTIANRLRSDFSLTTPNTAFAATSSSSYTTNITNGTRNGDVNGNHIVESAQDVPVPPPRRTTSSQKQLLANTTTRKPIHQNSTATSQEKAPIPLSQFVAKRTPFPTTSLTAAAAPTPAPVLRSSSAYTLNRAAQLRMQRDSVDRTASEQQQTKTRKTVQRGQSFAGADRKRNSWTNTTPIPAQPPQLQHPSAFPSMLRGSSAPQTQSSWDVRGIRRVSGSAAAAVDTPAPLLATKSVSTTNLRRRESLSTPRRRDSYISNNLQNGTNESNGAAYSGSTTQLNSTANNDLRRQSFGGGLYLRSAAAASGAATMGSTNSLTRRDSFGSQNFRPTSRQSNGGSSATAAPMTQQLNNGGSSVFLRADSAGNGNLVRRDRLGGSQTTLRRDSINNLMGSNRSINLNSMTSSATSYSAPRRDSFGSQNLLQMRRDSAASQQRASVPRDYVSSAPCAIRSHNMMNGLFDNASTDSVDGHYATVRSVGSKPANSILRKDSFKTSKKHVSYEDDAAYDTVDVATMKTSAASPKPTTPSTSNLLAEVQQQLTAANLSKHSTIMEENLLNDERQKKSLAKKLSFEETNTTNTATRRDRTNSTGSTGSASYTNAARRISMDSLDARRNSWTPITILGSGRRGSQTSTMDAEELDKVVRVKCVRI